MRVSARLQWVLCSGAVVAAGCESSADHPRDFEVLDSLGVEIVQIDWSQVSEVGRIDSLAQWVIGSEAATVGSESLPLYRVADVLTLDNGSIVIADGGSQELIRVEPQSGMVNRWGGRGEGPEEFRDIVRLFGGQDGRFGVLDGGSHRYVEVDTLGEFLAHHSLQWIPRIWAQHAAQGSDGSLIVGVAGERDVEGRSGSVRREGHLVRIPDWSMERLDSITAVNSTERFESSQYMGLAFLGATSVVAGGSEGVWVGDTGEQEVRLWNQDGTLMRIIRWTLPESRALTEGRKGDYWQYLLSVVPAEEMQMVEGMRDFVKWADSVPAFEALVDDANGSLWIGSYVSWLSDLFEAPIPPQEWIVLDFQAQRVKRVMTPEGFRLLRVGSDYVLGVHRNELGVESVRMYSLQWTQS